MQAPEVGRCIQIVRVTSLSATYWCKMVLLPMHETGLEKLQEDTVGMERVPRYLPGPKPQKVALAH